MKAYPLDIQELREFQGGHLGWFSRGHQEEAAFAAMAFLTAYEDGQVGPLPTHRIRHEYWRCVPVAGENFTCTFKARPGTCGAFPVTVVEDG